MGITVENNGNGGEQLYYKSWEPLSIFVDGRLVKYALILSFEEGIIAYWPPSLDDEVLSVAENIFFPLRHGLYIIIGGDELRYKYLGIAIYDKILLLVLDRRSNAEKMGYKLSRALLRKFILQSY